MDISLITTINADVTSYAILGSDDGGSTFTNLYSVEVKHDAKDSARKAASKNVRDTADKLVASGKVGKSYPAPATREGIDADKPEDAASAILAGLGE